MINIHKIAAAVTTIRFQGSKREEKNLGGRFLADVFPKRKSLPGFLMRDRHLGFLEVHLTSPAATFACSY